MTIWLDAHLSPQLARWLTETFGVTAIAVRDAGLREAEDEEIFLAARSKSVDVVLTKDVDFPELLTRHGAPPKILWLTCGNTSEAKLKQIFAANFREAMRLFNAGHDLVEIGDP